MDYFWRTTEHVTSPRRHCLSALTQFPASSSFPMITSVLVFVGLDVPVPLFSKLVLIASSILLDISFPSIPVGSSQQGGMICLLRHMSDQESGDQIWFQFCQDHGQDHFFVPRSGHGLLHQTFLDPWVEGLLSLAFVLMSLTLHLHLLVYVSIPSNTM